MAALHIWLLYIEGSRQRSAAINNGPTATERLPNAANHALNAHEIYELESAILPVEVNIKTIRVDAVDVARPNGSKHNGGRLWDVERSRGGKADHKNVLQLPVKCLLLKLGIPPRVICVLVDKLLVLFEPCKVNYMSLFL